MPIRVENMIHPSSTTTELDTTTKRSEIYLCERGMGYAKLGMGI